MTRLTFEELSRHLPRAVALPLASKYSFVTYCSPRKDFQPPTFAELEGSRPHAPLLLVSGGAAMGKTSLARELAAGTGAIYVDLSQLNVGAQTYQGLLLTCFGPAGVSAGIDALSQGRIALVIDALDEAQARSGDDNFTAFLHDLLDFAPSASLSNCASIVLLGRPETVWWVREMMTERSVPFQDFEVNYFGRDDAERFIARQLEFCGSKEVSASLERHPKSFSEARDTVLDHLQGVIADAGWDSATSDTFIGYAPVLEGIAEVLSTENFSEVPGFFLRAGSDDHYRARLGSSPWAVLVTILHRLLEREENKFVAAAQGKFGDLARNKDFEDWETLYEPDRQASLVSRYVCGEPNFEKPRHFPPELWPLYEELLRTFVPQHPFVDSEGEYASVLFSEYVRALAIARDPESDRGKVEIDFPDGYLPSPLLGHLAIFVQTLRPPSADSSPGSDNAVPVLNADLFGVWYESLTQARDDDGSVLEVSGWDETGRLVGTLRNRRKNVSYLFLIRGERAPLTFRKRLQDAFVIGCDLTLGQGGGTFRLGHDVWVSVNTLTIESRDLRVRGGDSLVALYAELLEVRRGGSPYVSVSEPTTLWCQWPDLGYPWARFRRPDLESPSAELLDRIEVQVDAILSEFKGRGEWTARDPETSTRYVQLSTLGKRVVSTLVEMRLVYYRRGRMALSLSRCRQADIDVVQLKRRGTQARRALAREVAQTIKAEL